MKRQHGQMHRKRVNLMPAKKRRDEWRQLVFQIAAEHPSWGPGRVNTELGESDVARAILAMDGEEDKGLPGARTIGRWQSEFKLLDTPAKLAFRMYSWPEAMRREALPWEASAALFDLSQYRKRPIPIRRAQWFWRVTLACPDAPLARRDELAGYLSAADALPEDARKATHETVEATISYAPWRSEKHQQICAEAIRRGEIKQLSLTLTADTTIDEAVEAGDELTGGATDSASVRGDLRSLFQAWADHPELSPPDALDAAIKEGTA